MGGSGEIPGLVLESCPRPLPWGRLVQGFKSVLFPMASTLQAGTFSLYTVSLK